MPSITVRKLDPDVHSFLQQEGANHGRSMEEEVRVILTWYKDTNTESASDLARRIHRRFKKIGGGDDLVIPERTPLPDPLTFSE